MLTNHTAKNWTIPLFMCVFLYQQCGRGKGQTGVLHASVWERRRQNQDVVLTPNVGSSEILSGF